MNALTNDCRDSCFQRPVMKVTGTTVTWQLTLLEASFHVCQFVVHIFPRHIQAEPFICWEKKELSWTSNWKRKFRTFIWKRKDWLGTYWISLWFSAELVVVWNFPSHGKAPLVNPQRKTTIGWFVRQSTCAQLVQAQLQLSLRHLKEQVTKDSGHSKKN